MCKATLDFEEHQQPTSLASLLQRRPAQRLQQVLLTLEVFLLKPVEDEACRSPLPDCFDLGNVFSVGMGPRPDAAYSNSGRTKTLYAFSLMLEALILSCV